MWCKRILNFHLLGCDTCHSISHKRMITEELMRPCKESRGPLLINSLEHGTFKKCSLIFWKFKKIGKASKLNYFEKNSHDIILLHDNEHNKGSKGNFVEVHVRSPEPSTSKWGWKFVSMCFSYFWFVQKSTVRTTIWDMQ